MVRGFAIWLACDQRITPYRFWITSRMTTGWFRVRLEFYESRFPPMREWPLLARFLIQRHPAAKAGIWMVMQASIFIYSYIPSKSTLCRSFCWFLLPTSRDFWMTCMPTYLSRVTPIPTHRERSLHIGIAPRNLLESPNPTVILCCLLSIISSKPPNLKPFSSTYQTRHPQSSGNHPACP